MFRKTLIPIAATILSVSVPAFAHEGELDDHRGSRSEYLQERIEAGPQWASEQNPYLTPWEQKRLMWERMRERRYNRWLARHRYPYYRW